MPKNQYQNQEKAAIFGAWLEGKLTSEQRQHFEALCTEDADFAEQVQAANQITVQAQEYQEIPPGNWNKGATFDGQSETKWWHWQGLPIFSGGLSVLAIVLVLSGFEVRLDGGAMTFSFSKPQQNVDLIVEQKLAAFRQSQQQLLASYTQSLQEQQLATSTQLTNYLLASSRQERKEDFGELIKFINEQRNDDQVYFARQFNELQQEIFNAPISSDLPDTQRPNDLEE